MPLVNPQIAMSYRPTVEYQPRNALAEYAQIQQIVGGQRQAEVAEMQLESLRRERDALGQIQAAIVAKGGPPDLEAAADAMIKTGKPEFLTQGMAIRTALRNQREAEAYRRDFGGGAAAPAAAAPAAGDMRQTQDAGYVAAVQDLERRAPGISELRMPGAAAPVVSVANALAPVAAAPVTNAMVAPAAVAPDANTLRLRALEAQYRRIGNNPELANEKALVLKQIEDVQATIRAESATPPEAKFMRALGLPLTREGFAEFESLKQRPGEFERLLSQSGLPKADQTALIQQRLKKEATHAPGTQVVMPPQEKAFEAELGKGQAERILKSQAGARDAVGIIDTVNTGRQIMQSGMITGAGAEFLVNLNQALKTVGIDAGYADAAANSQAFAANMAGNVGRIIKQFGAGTGLSNADREYAEKMAGGKITLDASAIRRILDINERAARNVIKLHNKDVSGIKTNIPLTVEEPPATRAAASITAPPPAAIEYLRANPGMRGAFDAKYGAGAADRALKGQ